MAGRRMNGTASGGRRCRRGNGRGTLQKSPGGFIARWWVTAPDGTAKRVSRSTGTHDLARARAFLDDATRELNLDREERMLDSLASARLGLDARRESLRREREEANPALLLEDAFEAYRASPERSDASERTLGGYEAQFSALVRWMGERHPEVRELRQVDRTVADEFARHLALGHSPNTYNKHLVFFSCLWRILGDEAGATTNPWSRMKKKRLVTHSRRELTVEELRRLTSGLAGEMRTLFAIGIYTGMRLGDCCTLDWGCVDLERGLISVTPRKTAASSGRRTVIPIHPTLMSILAETPEERRTGPVLPDTRASYETEPANVTGRIRKVFTRAGIRTSVDLGDGSRKRPEAGFHSLRHTFVSLCANASVPLAVVQALVAHSNPAMTRHYFHAEQKALESAVLRLPDVIDV